MPTIFKYIFLNGWNFNWDHTESKDQFEDNGHFYNTDFFATSKDDLFPDTFRSSLISLNKVVSIFFSKIDS